MKNRWVAAGFALALPVAMFAQGKGKVVEEIIARVNNDIITFSDYQKAQGQLQQEVAQDCPACSQAQIQANVEQRQKDVLRDLIDQQLLIQRGKDLGINVDSDLTKRLDEIRQQNSLKSMEDLEKAVETQGVSWEEYKASIRNNLLTGYVVRQEVGRNLAVSEDDIKQYYEEHKNEFNRPEQVYLSEILVSTEGKSADEISALEKKANDLLSRVKKGEDFGELAKRYSDGPTAKQSGELGAYQKGQLAKPIEDAVFKLNKNDMTDVIRTKSGFEVFRVLEHYDAGLQPLSKVENEIANKLYAERMQPALRSYLADLREQSYLIIKPGYVDSAAVGGNSVIEESQPTPDSPKKQKKLKKGK